MPKKQQVVETKELRQAISEFSEGSQLRWRTLLNDKRSTEWLVNSICACPGCGHPVIVVRFQGYKVLCQRHIKPPKEKKPVLAPCGWKLII